MDIIGMMKVPLSVDIKHVWLLFCTTGIITMCIKIWRTLSSQVCSSEPPVVRHIIPYVGHLWGLMKHSHDYVNSLWWV